MAAKKKRGGKRGATKVTLKNKRVSKRKASSKPRPKSKMQGKVPLKVLESRAAYLVGLVERRGGTVRASTKLTHRTPKQAGRLRAGKKRRKK